MQEGTSTIHNINQIDRGYENIDNRLKAFAQKLLDCKAKITTTIMKKLTLILGGLQ